MKPSAPNQQSAPEGAWTVRDVSFPAGTEFCATHKGSVYHGKVASGALVVTGKAYNSPSAAAVEITKTSTNGWAFWKCKFPDSDTWVQLKRLRQCESESSPER